MPRQTLSGTLRPELGRIALGCLCLVGTNAFSLAIPWLLKQAIDALRDLPPAVAHGIVVRDAIAIIAFAVRAGRDPDLVADLHLRRRPQRRIRAAPRPVRPPDPARPGLLPAPPDRRHHVPADQRPGRGAHAVRARPAEPAQHRAGLRDGAGAAAEAVAAPHAAGPHPLPAAARGGQARQPPHPPRQPGHPGAAGDDVDRDPGGPGRHRGDQALHAGRVAAARVSRRQRRVPGSGADAGAGARHADAAVRDAGRRRAR